MSQEQISRNPDLKRLQDEEYSVEIHDGYLILRDIPYVNERRLIQTGALVSNLSSLSGDRTVGPIADHVALFAGEIPCDQNGRRLSIYHSAEILQIGDLAVRHKFSGKPPGGYPGYYEKMVNYATILANEARAIDSSVTEKPHKVIDSDTTESVFNYPDTNSSRAGIDEISQKLEGAKIAIVGVGGTGSYILDFVAKTCVKEIHLFDGDNFVNHNAFRAPGAASKPDLNQSPKKAEYFKCIYSNMHSNVRSHPYDITNENLDELSNMDFVFIAIDNRGAAVKRQIVDFLLENKIAFVDTGIGVLRTDASILGHVRVTTCTPDKSDHINERITFATDGEKDDYATNIQIAELNALGAILAVIKWKKLNGYYQDLALEFNTTYSINDGILVHNDHHA